MQRGATTSGDIYSMKEMVKQFIFDYFRQLGQRGGKSVQPGDILPASLRHTLPNHQLKHLYAEVVKELLDDGFLYEKPSKPRTQTSLGSIGGYGITEAGIGRL